MHVSIGIGLISIIQAIGLIKHETRVLFNSDYCSLFQFLSFIEIPSLDFFSVKTIQIYHLFVDKIRIFFFCFNKTRIILNALKTFGSKIFYSNEKKNTSSNVSTSEEVVNKLTL